MLSEMKASTDEYDLVCVRTVCIKKLQLNTAANKLELHEGADTPTFCTCGDKLLAISTGIFCCIILAQQRDVRTRMVNHIIPLQFVLCSGYTVFSMCVFTMKAFLLPVDIQRTPCPYSLFILVQQ